MGRARSRSLLLLIGAVLAGCAVEPERAVRCDASAPERPAYEWVAATTAHASPATSGMLRVIRYRLTIPDKTVVPCDEVRLQKELTVATPPEARAGVWEIQDLFAGNGTFIVRRSEDVSSQLARSGRYRRTIVLPVPATTPAGRYRVVTRLVVKQNGRELPLANATAEFRVRAPSSTSGNRAPRETRH